MGEAKKEADIVESYRLSVDASLKQYHSTIKGLSTNEAQSRQEKFGANKLVETKKRRTP